MTKKIIFMGLLSFVCSLLGCNAQTGMFKSVEVEEFHTVIADSTTLLLDVRTPEEYAEGHIGNAMNIDVLNGNFLAEALKSLPKEKTIALYCRSGRRSKKAATILAKNGYSVVELNSGYLGWTKASSIPLNKF
ncbi:rhodanese-like domain-containing protein [Palleniella muris]|uniref:Rhodanese-like domain-containing protein n=1 Tax=Palleniella muris TaxID=3038145 RepID=A0AC61QT51_9BACT|nr:rhodanese-like domain-containing protein [Palleniella muris]TGX83569.1 rhodanese-like domain-containing protein [Palleniella muris]